MSQYPSRAIAARSARSAAEARSLELGAQAKDYSRWIHLWLPGIVLRGAHWCIFHSAVMLTRPRSFAHMAATAAALPCAAWRLGARPSRAVIWTQRHVAGILKLCFGVWRSIRLTHSTRRLATRVARRGLASTWVQKSHYCGVAAMAGRPAPVAREALPQWVEGGEVVR